MVTIGSSSSIMISSTVMEDGTNNEPGFVAVTHAALLVGYGQDENGDGCSGVQGCGV